MAASRPTDWDDLVRPSLHGIEPYRPGPSLSELRERYGVDEIVKLNWNEGLFGPFPGALEAAAAELENAWMYPEQAFSDLREAICRWRDVPPEQVVPAHGIQALSGRCRRFPRPWRVGRPARAHLRPLCAGLRSRGRARSSTSPVRSSGSTWTRWLRPPSGSALASLSSAIRTTRPDPWWSRTSGTASSTRCQRGARSSSTRRTASTWIPTAGSAAKTTWPAGRPVVRPPDLLEDLRPRGPAARVCDRVGAARVLSGRRAGAVQRQPRGPGRRHGEPAEPGDRRGAQAPGGRIARASGELLEAGRRSSPAVTGELRVRRRRRRRRRAHGRPGVPWLSRSAPGASSAWRAPSASPWRPCRSWKRPHAS